MSKESEQFIVIKGADGGGMHVDLYESKEALQARIERDNDENIREDCRPAYVHATPGHIAEICRKGSDGNLQIIIKGSAIIPRPIRVVMKYNLE